MRGVEGVAGRSDAVVCFQEEWKREKRLGESGVEGEDTVVESGDGEAEAEGL